MTGETAAILKRALKAVDEAAIPPDLRGVALAKAIDLESGGMAANTYTPAAAIASPSNAAVVAQAGDPLSMIAAKLSLPREVVESVFHVEGGEVDLVVAPNKLDSSKSRGTEQVAMLVAGGRQAIGLDDDGWTSVEPIRDRTQHFGRLDANNFAATIRDMRDVFLVRGERTNRKVKLTAPGWQRVTELVRELGS